MRTSAALTVEEPFLSAHSVYCLFSGDAKARLKGVGSGGDVQWRAWKALRCPDLTSEGEGTRALRRLCDGTH